MLVPDPQGHFIVCASRLGGEAVHGLACISGPRDTRGQPVQMHSSASVSPEGRETLQNLGKSTEHISYL
jgi:hypothetical protein